MVKLGIKGFDKDLKCMEHQYKIGETYEMAEKPVLCETGYHYSKTIQDVFRFYPNVDKNRFCIVEILGDIENGINKCCTNRIKILREFHPKKEMNTIPYEELSELSELGFIIGGSLALKILGWKIDRDIKEVDLIIKKEKYSQIKDKVFFGYKSVNRFSGMDSVSCYIGLTGFKFDIITSTNINYVVREYMGYDLHIQDENIIWEHKLKYALRGSLKHMRDISANNISFGVKPKKKYFNRKYDFDDLPF